MSRAKSTEIVVDGRQSTRLEYLAAIRRQNPPCEFLSSTSITFEFHCENPSGTHRMPAPTPIPWWSDVAWTMEQSVGAKDCRETMSRANRSKWPGRCSTAPISADACQVPSRTSPKVWSAWTSFASLVRPLTIEIALGIQFDALSN